MFRPQGSRSTVAALGEVLARLSILCAMWQGAQQRVHQADLLIWIGTSILNTVRAFRRHIVVHAIVCMLLSWAAADLLVPQLCSAEQETQPASHGGQQDQDDCFCCCSHVERARPIEIAFAELTPALRQTFPTQSLPIGAPRTVYHPPLVS